MPVFSVASAVLPHVVEAASDIEVALNDGRKMKARVVGTDEDGTEITAQNGRYGPYLKKGTDSRSLTAEDQLLSITLDEALKIYAQPKQRGRAAATPPLKELGNDPVSGRPVVSVRPVVTST